MSKNISIPRAIAEELQSDLHNLMDSYIVQILNKASWSLEEHITDLKEELKQVKIERDKWMLLAMSATEASSANMINMALAITKLEQEKNENLPSNE